jgi:hypothetical protein
MKALAIFVTFMLIVNLATKTANAATSDVGLPSIYNISDGVFFTNDLIITENDPAHPGQQKILNGGKLAFRHNQATNQISGIEFVPYVCTDGSRFGPANPLELWFCQMLNQGNVPTPRKNPFEFPGLPNSRSQRPAR